MSFAQPTSATNREVPLLIQESKPDPARLDEVFSQFLEVLALAQEWKKLMPLMDWFNNQHLADAGKLTADEVQEAIDELQLDQLRKFLAEWADSLNLAAGLERSQYLHIQHPSEVLAYVNGQGKRDGVYESAQEIALNFSLQPADLRKDIIQFYTLMTSGLIHAPQFTVDLVQLSLEKMRDNLRNYPPELYTMTDATGKLLNPEQLEKKYRHVYRCLKWLRGLYEPTRMLPDDWRAVEPEILAFQSSDESFRMLQTTWFKLHPEMQTILVPEPIVGETEDEDADEGVFNHV